MKTLLLNKGVQLITEEAKLGQESQRTRFGLHDQQLSSLNFISQIKGAGSSARIEHHPPKNPENIDPQINWSDYREFLLAKFSRSDTLSALTFFSSKTFPVNQ